MIRFYMLQDLGGSGALVWRRTCSSVQKDLFLRRRLPGFMSVTWMIHVCDTNDSCVWYESFMCVTCLMHEWDINHSCVWYDSIISACHDSFTCEWHVWLWCVMAFILHEHGSYFWAPPTRTRVCCSVRCSERCSVCCSKISWRQIQIACVFVRIDV